LSIRDRDRAWALAALAPHLPADLLDQALAVATAITSDPDRARALAALAPHLPADQQPAVLGQALAATTTITNDYDRAQVLVWLAPHLPADLLSPALAAATAITSDYYRARALAGLAPHLPADLLGQALTVVPEGSLETLLALLERVTQLSPTVGNELLLGLLRSCFALTDRRSCLLVLSITASQFKRIGSSDAISECVGAINDVYRWWP